MAAALATGIADPTGALCRGLGSAADLLHAAHQLAHRGADQRELRALPVGAALAGGGALAHVFSLALGRGGETTDLHDQLGDPRAHPVEILGKIAHLIPRLNPQYMTKITGGKPAHGLTDAAKR